MNKEFEIDNLNFKQINAMKILERDLKRDPFLLINFNELVNDLIFERNSYKKQRDELINDMAEIKKKAKAFDEILNVDYIVTPDDYAHEITKIVDKYWEEQ
ncbi:hypothetical protein [Staphylococcus pasteuri]|uniref:hypothetical protein n=1 Tax=Staphylococcus pasteuri TaxID=45972 RepID=UPI00313310F2